MDLKEQREFKYCIIGVLVAVVVNIGIAIQLAIIAGLAGIDGEVAGTVIARFCTVTGVLLGIVAFKIGINLSRE